MKKIILEKILRDKLVAIIRGLDFEQNLKVIDLLIKSHINVLEVTLNTKNALDVIKESRCRYEDKAFIGAGTVTNEEEAKNAINAGAQFIITPNLSKNVINICNKKNILVIPGAFSPTEIVEAYEEGCDLVKLFPAKTLGANFIKNIKEPLNKIKIMAVGGINLENMNEFFENDVDALGIGGSLINKELIQKGDYKELQKHFIAYKKYINKYTNFKEVTVNE